eukprot:CAMPEP_0181200200 /NCGR_PEP_ID=MMETSP1096-20121128/17622_1 /TAXON_ID=156174 ORGANISM="Chrysochromulina ericina, Strain CCMP281" /NCGR_SAMPLE_ID=MMETSP1096 /ASSEMBLY_ACC=CAM_ASM_000453 /LENGTH=37 /DNA_ID= /DNA_START= /DNA_END= /DNA_ORIENTATION=
MKVPTPTYDDPSPHNMTIPAHPLKDGNGVDRLEFVLG